jgi:phenylacetate-CoA ligase
VAIARDVSSGEPPRSVLSTLAALGRNTSSDAALAAQALLAKTERWTAEQLGVHQLIRLRELVEHARSTVPFYAERLRGLAPGQPRALEEWRAVPALERADLQERGEQLKSPTVPSGHAVVREATTSGSTGAPVTVVVDETVNGLEQVFGLRYHQLYERDLTQKAAIIRAIKDGSAAAPGGGRERRWSPHPLSGELVLLDVRSTVHEQLEWLARESPAYLATYATNAAELARTAEREGRRLPGLREVSTFAEVVPEGLEELLLRVWSAKHADAYSTSEFGFLAFRCAGGSGYHVQSEHVLLEILRADGTPCAAGETGRVVVTALHNFAMPLLRYALGDFAEVGAECVCGRRLPVIQRIRGRVRNMLTLPNGERVWPLFGTNEISRVAPVRQFRLVQKTRKALVLELSVTRALDRTEEQQLRELVLGTLGHPFDLELAYLPAIARAESGKFEEFRSEL